MSDVRSAETMRWEEVWGVWWWVTDAGRIMAEIRRLVPGTPAYEIVRGHGTGERYVNLETAQKRVEEAALGPGGSGQ